MVRIGDAVKRKNARLLDGWKKSMTDKNVVNTFAATGIGWALIGAMKMLNGIGKVILNE